MAPVPPSRYKPWDISAWVVVGQEPGGAESKVWVAPADHATDTSRSEWWLFKPVKQATTYRRLDDWSEKIAAELAGLIGLPAARVELAVRGSDAGVISKNVAPASWSLEAGDTLLVEFPGYESCAVPNPPKNRVGHTLPNIRSVLDGAMGPPDSNLREASAFDVFVGFLLFDAWIANTDRHAVNWGALLPESGGRAALAPSFDHGSALASGVQEHDLPNPERFARKGFAHRFEGGREITLVELARSGVTLGGQAAAQWIDRLRDVPDQSVARVLQGIDGMSETRRKFLGELLAINRRRLIGDH